MDLDLNYSSQIILGIICLMVVIIFCVRRRMVGEIIGTASLSRFRYFYLIISLFTLYLGVKGLYFAFHYQGYISNFSLHGLISNLLGTLCFLVLFLTSKIYIGSKGVSVPIIPLFLPNSEIVDHQISLNTLILEREGKKVFKIKLEPNDVKNIESSIRQLQKRDS
ncbi:MAG: hypothetical protein KBA08_11105 [Firmicutes bacterium]|nr:hypothetical protein [Bacillota bacterium]